MTNATETTQRAAQQMIQSNHDDLVRELINEGAYHTVVEGGFHQEALTDEEADFLAVTLVEDGIFGLTEYLEDTE